MYCICPPHAQRLMHTQESWALAHTPHTLLTCLPLVAVMAVFCCVVLRDVALAEAARTSSRKKVVPLPTAVTCSISHSLSPLHLDSNIVSGREVAVFYRTAVTTLQTSCVGGRKAVSHSLEWPFTLSVVKPSVLLVYSAPYYTLYIRMLGLTLNMQSPDWISTMCVIKYCLFISSHTTCHTVHVVIVM